MYVYVRERGRDIWVAVSNVFLVAVVEISKCLQAATLKKLLYMCHRVIALKIFFYSNSQ